MVLNDNEKVYNQHKRLKTLIVLPTTVCIVQCRLDINIAMMLLHIIANK